MVARTRKHENKSREVLNTMLVRASPWLFNHIMGKSAFWSCCVFVRSHSGLKSAFWSCCLFEQWGGSSKQLHRMRFSVYLWYVEALKRLSNSLLAMFNVMLIVRCNCVLMVSYWSSRMMHSSFIKGYIIHWINHHNIN